MQILVPSDKVTRARKFAVESHGEQKYGDEFPYLLHLLLAEGVLLRFGVFDEEFRCMAILHDVLEDTKRTYEEVDTFFGRRVADAVAAVTEPKGGNRKWRHEQTYPRTAKNPDAILIKLADRIANVESGGKRIGMYLKEHAEFKNALFNAPVPDSLRPTVNVMWAYLDELLVAVKPA